MNKIALLNDAFRRTFAGGKVTMTAGVYALPDMESWSRLSEQRFRVDKWSVLPRLGRYAE